MEETLELGLAVRKVMQYGVMPYRVMEYGVMQYGE